MATIKKAIAPVPTAQEVNPNLVKRREKEQELTPFIYLPRFLQFLDVILSKTQRKTPTVIRSGFKISRIRAFCELQSLRLDERSKANF